MSSRKAHDRELFVLRYIEMSSLQESTLTAQSSVLVYLFVTVSLVALTNKKHRHDNDSDNTN